MTQNKAPSSLFSILLEQLEYAKGGIVYLAPERLQKFDPLAIASLQSAGLMQKSPPLIDILCEGCEQACIMPVQIRNDKKDKPVAFIVCDKRDDIGRVPMDFSRLEMQIFTLAGLADWLALTLPTDRSPQEIDAGILYNLGAVTISHKRHDVFLCRKINSSLSLANGNAPILITLHSKDQHKRYPSAGADSLIHFENSKPKIDYGYLKQAVVEHASSEEIALEIGLVNSEIILINHATGSRKTLAKPDFGSNNDSTFEHLYANAGKVFTEKQILAGAEIKGLNMQKFVEQLGFKGNTRKLFWQVSKKGIRFNRTATFKQLDALKIAPDTLS